MGFLDHASHRTLKKVFQVHGPPAARVHLIAPTIAFCFAGSGEAPSQYSWEVTLEVKPKTNSLWIYSFLPPSLLNKLNTCYVLGSIILPTWGDVITIK